jgi:hypothetical protein
MKYDRSTERSRDRNGSSPRAGRAEAFRRTGLGLGSLDGAVARRRVAPQSIKEMMSRMRDVVDGPVERRLVDFGRPGKAGQLADELKRAGADFIVRRRWLEIMERSDVPARGGFSQQSRGMEEAERRYRGDGFNGLGSGWAK